MALIARMNFSPARRLPQHWVRVRSRPLPPGRPAGKTDNELEPTSLCSNRWPTAAELSSGHAMKPMPLNPACGALVSRHTIRSSPPPRD